MRPHSGSIGSFTFRISSALDHTASAEGAISAPTERYASSLKPDPSPAPCSISTVWPSLTSDSAPAGTSATRCSAVLISFGTPTITVLLPLPLPLRRHWGPTRPRSDAPGQRTPPPAPTPHPP